MHPHTMMLPPPCLTVGCTWQSRRGSVGSFQHHWRPSEPKTLNFDSSDQMTWLQSSTSRSFEAFAHRKRFALCFFCQQWFLFLHSTSKPLPPETSTDSLVTQTKTLSSQLTTYNCCISWFWLIQHPHRKSLITYAQKTWSSWSWTIVHPSINFVSC